MRQKWCLPFAHLYTAALAVIGLASASAAASEPPARLGGLLVASDSTDENAPANLYVARPDGTVLCYLTQDGNWNRNAGWSYDGSKVVWDVRNSTGGVWIMDADGKRKRELTAVAPGVPSHAFAPAFSPDGRHVVYADYPTGDPGPNPLVGIEVFVINIHSGYRRQLTSTSMQATTNTGAVIQWSELPAYSPDGRKIVYSSTQSGNSEIWVMTADGGNKQQLTFNTPANGPQGPDANFPSFSPDGRKIVFLCGWETLYGNICVMNADGSGRIQLTHNPDDGLQMDEPSSDEPAWSPDGRSIMFDSNQFDPNLGQRAAETWVMNADGSDQRVLIPHLYGEGRNPWIKYPVLRRWSYDILSARLSPVCDLRGMP